MAEFTPGPWKWHRSRTRMHLLDSQGSCFAQVSMPAPNNQPMDCLETYAANAELIAAAPKMHGEIERLRARIEQLEEEKASAERMAENRYQVQSQQQQLICDLQAEIRRLTAENAGLREESARLDRIHANLGAVAEMIVTDDLQLEVDLRAAVDAARGAK